jgi:hypothetical protein
MPLLFPDWLAIFPEIKPQPTLPQFEAAKVFVQCEFSHLDCIFGDDSVCAETFLGLAIADYLVANDPQVKEYQTRDDRVEYFSRTGTNGVYLSPYRIKMNRLIDMLGRGVSSAVYGTSENQYNYYNMRCGYGTRYK